MDPFWVGFGLQRGHFSVKIYAKMKELDPVGGCAPAHPLDPPMQLFPPHINSGNVIVTSEKPSLLVGDNRGFW